VTETPSQAASKDPQHAQGFTAIAVSFQQNFFLDIGEGIERSPANDLKSSAIWQQSALYRMGLAVGTKRTRWQL
jgi:hypothetical protein